ncbi:MAG: ABC transporter ATP-binding protein, partial [bacterium]
MIKVENLTRHFGDIKAVEGINFTVQPGEVLGFLGPNGAGKSTTMKMLAGFLTPTSGKASIFGHDIVTQSLEARRMLGYLPEGAPSYGEMSVTRFLDFIAQARGLKGSAGEKAKQKVIDELHLEKVLNQPIDTLSKGFKRRVGLAQAIIHNPRVLLLDEPTDGLDPNQKAEVRALIRSMAEDRIIMISTHILEEVDALCQRAIIIARGKILA